MSEFNAPHYGQDGPCGPVHDADPVERLRTHLIACPICCDPRGSIGGCTTSTILSRQIWDKDFGTETTEK